jgi:hypothetical protein
MLRLAVEDPQLADLLAAWVTGPGGLRLLVTSRYPFSLPDRADRQLTTHHLGRLSFAETRKLLWRLPGLDALTSDDKQRAYAVVGGHPRALEIFDALLRAATLDSRHPRPAGERAARRRSWESETGNDQLKTRPGRRFADQPYRLRAPPVGLGNPVRALTSALVGTFDGRHAAR